MTNDELDKAIDTAARHSSYDFNNGDRQKLMLAHLNELLAIQIQRARIMGEDHREVAKQALATPSPQAALNNAIAEELERMAVLADSETWSSGFASDLLNRAKELRG